QRSQAAKYFIQRERRWRRRGATGLGQVDQRGPATRQVEGEGCLGGGVGRRRDAQQRGKVTGDVRGVRHPAPLPPLQQGGGRVRVQGLLRLPHPQAELQRRVRPGGVFRPARAPSRARAGIRGLFFCAARGRRRRR
ncbi:unnamed protein product, partial [Ectocarpus sp. 12 AP-2014]